MSEVFGEYLFCERDNIFNGESDSIALPSNNMLELRVLNGTGGTSKIS